MILRALVLAATLVATAAAADPFDRPPSAETIRIDAEPVPVFVEGREATRFGRLEYLGGLVLTSPARDFGGLSGLAVSADGGRFVAVSDVGLLIGGRLSVDASGAPVAVSDAWLAPILDPVGRRFRAKRDKDAEAIAVDPETGALLLAFERNARFGRLAPGAPYGMRLAEIPAPDIATGNGNAGFEAFGVFPPGTRHAGKRLAITEEGPRGGDSEGFLIGDRTLAFTVGQRKGYAVTDLAILPDGDILILERRFTPPAGIRARLRLVAAESLAEGASVDGAIVLEADGLSAIDNMEGLAVHADADGRTIVTMVSDDNFSFLQKTVLLRFAFAVQ